jgi:hypothetical protein
MNKVIRTRFAIMPHFGECITDYCVECGAAVATVLFQDRDVEAYKRWRLNRLIVHLRVAHK